VACPVLRESCLHVYCNHFDLLDWFHRIYTAFFVENVGSPFFALKRNESGKVVMDVLFSTDAKIPMIAASDIGGWALAAFKNPDEWAGE